MQYFLSNRAAFDDADAHGGLFSSIDRNVPLCCIRGFRCVDGYAGQNAGNISG